MRARWAHFTFDQADALLTVAESRSLHAYIVVSLLSGARKGHDSGSVVMASDLGGGTWT